MTMLSPYGRVPRRRPVRKPAPVFILLGVLVVVAIIVWWQVFHPDNASGNRAALCNPKADANIAKMNPATVQVRIYNSTDTAGLAQGVSTELTKRKFKVVATSNDPLGREVKGVGEIRYGPDGAQQAAFVGFQVPGVKMLVDTRSGPVVDLAIGPEYKQLATPRAAAQAAQKAAKEAGGETGGGPECADLPSVELPGK